MSARFLEKPETKKHIFAQRKGFYLQRLPIPDQLSSAKALAKAEKADL